MIKIQYQGITKTKDEKMLAQMPNTTICMQEYPIVGTYSFVNNEYAGHDYLWSQSLERISTMMTASVA